jgi:hypothetical protein
MGAGVCSKRRRAMRAEIANDVSKLRLLLQDLEASKK